MYKTVFVEFILLEDDTIKYTMEKSAELPFIASKDLNYKMGDEELIARQIVYNINTGVVTVYSDGVLCQDEESVKESFDYMKSVGWEPKIN